MIRVAEVEKDFEEKRQEEGSTGSKDHDAKLLKLFHVLLIHFLPGRIIIDLLNLFSQVEIIEGKVGFLDEDARITGLVVSSVKIGLHAFEFFTVVQVNILEK